MNTFFQLAAAFAAWCCVGAMSISLTRLLRGPTAQDRVLAFDSFYISGMLTLLILGIRSASSVYFDVALLIAIFGFIGTTALAKFLLQGEVIEP
jgi:multicomponent K+:H+ antiporter subunit F